MNSSIVISIDNQYELVNNFFEHLFNVVDIDRYEFVVVTDGCKNMSTILYLKDLATRLSGFKLIIQEVKGGYGIANNIAVANVSNEYLVFLNSDVLPEKGSIDKLINYLKSDNSICAVQGLLVYPQSMLVQSTGHLFMDYYNAHAYQSKKMDDICIRSYQQRQSLTTAFCAMRKVDFYKYGRFDEFYYNAIEGMEITLKMSLNGEKCMYCPDAVAFHSTGAARNLTENDEDQQLAYFWSKWGSQIERDIEKYISYQLSEEILRQNYFLINCNFLRGWENILNILGINWNGQTVVHDRFSKSINLYYNLPYSAINYHGPYLFITNSIDAIKGNRNWVEVRNNCEDIVIDTHGNLEYLIDLV
jgi:GT2 family glycosyltransferase